MKRIIEYLVLLMILCCFLCCKGQTEFKTEITAEYLKPIMAPGAELSEVRPSEHDLSESEVMVKLADYVVDKGYFNYEYASSKNEKLPYAHIETPIFKYWETGTENLGSYFVYAVDDYGNAVHAAYVSSRDNSSMDKFVGSEVYIKNGGYVTTKRDVVKIAENAFPGKLVSEPESILIRTDNAPRESLYWYFAVTESTNPYDTFESVVADGTADVDEYLILPATANVSHTENRGRARGIDDEVFSNLVVSKITDSANFYKVILANKTYIDENGRTRAVDEEGKFSQYYGKGLGSVADVTNIKTERVKLL